jgi:hypothetical protein
MMKRVLRKLQYQLAKLILFRHPILRDAKKYQEMQYKIENSSSFIKPNRASFRGEIERQRRKGSYPLRQNGYYFEPLEDFSGSKMQWNQVIRSLEIPNLHVPEIYGFFESIDDVKTNDLPTRFVIKPDKGHSSHGVAGVFRISDDKFHDIFSDKFLSWPELVEEHKKQLSIYKTATRESVIVEEMLSNDSPNRILDWKFFIAGGELIAFFASRKEPGPENKPPTMYHANWNRFKQPMPTLHNDRLVDRSIQLPPNIDEMIEIAKEVATSFARSTCRIDLFNIDGKIYFGEYTPTPGGHYRAALEQDKELGELLEIADAKFNLMVLTRLIESGHPKIGRGIWRV